MAIDRVEIASNPQRVFSVSIAQDRIQFYCGTTFRGHHVDTFADVTPTEVREIAAGLVHLATIMEGV